VARHGPAERPRAAPLLAGKVMRSATSENDIHFNPTEMKLSKKVISIVPDALLLAGTLGKLSTRSFSYQSGKLSLLSSGDSLSFTTVLFNDHLIEELISEKFNYLS